MCGEKNHHRFETEICTGQHVATKNHHSGSPTKNFTAGYFVIQFFTPSRAEERFTTAVYQKIAPL
jgi:hypothetical protein